MLKPRLVATLATNQASDDLRVFLKTLELWNKDDLPTVYIFTDTIIETLLVTAKYPGKIVTKNTLQKYSHLTRDTMEKIQGSSSSTLWMDFQMEKMNLLQWVFDSEPTEATTNGVFYFDADITFLTSLPTIPSTATVALSPHFIRVEDEAKYGRFNGGFLWMRDSAAIQTWRAGCADSRFFEQAALETLGGIENHQTLYEFPIQHNYGWWRFWQSERPPALVVREFTFRRSNDTAGLLVQNAPLCSIHTHWKTTDFYTMRFNAIILENLKKLAAMHPPASRLYTILTGSHI